MEYEIKITGSGTREELIAALQTIISELKIVSDITDVEWEDATLMTVVTEIEVDDELLNAIKQG